VVSVPVAAASSLGRYLVALFADSQSGVLVEVRVPSRPRWRRFFSAGRLDLVERHVRSCARAADVFIGVAPRIPLRRGGRQFGGADAVGVCSWVWVDCDGAEAWAALEVFTPPPSMVVASGGGVHGYWRLAQPVTSDVLARANARMARLLGADSSAADAARILRPPETFNHKLRYRVAGRPAPVRLRLLSDVRYDLAEVVGDPLAVSTSRVRPSVQRAGTALTAGELTLEGKRRMLGIIRLLESTPDGQRHRRLYWAARQARELYDAGHTSEGPAIQALLAAAEGVGLTDDDGERAVRLTVQQGWAKGGSS
jgi:hypothetical protein